MKHDFLVYLSHSWGTTPEQKKKEHEYNVEYYRTHKEELKRQRDERRKEMLEAKAAYENTKDAYERFASRYPQTQRRAANYANTIEILEKEREEAANKRNWKEYDKLNNKIFKLQFAKAGADMEDTLTWNTLENLVTGKMALDSTGRSYKPNEHTIESSGRTKSRMSIDSRGDYAEKLAREYEKDRWEDPYAARERDRAKAYGENEKAKLEAQRKKSKK